NKSSSSWNNCYLAFWTDDDLGEAIDDVMGCDTNFQLGYSYNYSNYDPVYGTAPPAVGTVLLYGGDTYTGNPNDTAIYCDKLKRIIKVGYKPNRMYALNW